MAKTAEEQQIRIGKKQAQGGRENMEDRLEAQHMQTAQGLPLTLAIVADGIGGQNCGEVAAQLTINTVCHEVEAAAVNDEKQIPQLLLNTLVKANSVVFREARADKAKDGMGSTATVVAIFENKLYLANVGDSRAYLLRNGRLNQITVDHTWGREMLRKGYLTETEAQNHPKSEALVRSIGYTDHVEVDLGIYLDGDDEEMAQKRQGYLLQTNDRILVCSDGLIKNRVKGKGHFVEDDEIIKIISRNEPQKASENLVKKALSRKADDNVSAIVLEMPGSKHASGCLALAKRLFVITLLVGLIAAIVAVLFSKNNNLVMGILPNTAVPTSSENLVAEVVPTSTKPALQPTSILTEELEEIIPIQAILEDGGLRIDGEPVDNTVRGFKFEQTIENGDEVSKFTLGANTTIYMDKNSEIKILPENPENAELAFEILTGRILVDAPVQNVYVTHIFEDQVWTNEANGLFIAMFDPGGYFAISCFGEADCLVRNRDGGEPITLNMGDKLAYGRSDNLIGEGIVELADYVDINDFVPNDLLPTPTPTSTSPPGPTNTALPTPIPSTPTFTAIALTTTPTVIVTETPTPTVTTEFSAEETPTPPTEEVSSPPPEP